MRLGEESQCENVPKMMWTWKEERWRRNKKKQYNGKMSVLSPSWEGLGLWHSDFKSTIYKRSKSSLIRKKEKWAMKSRQLWVSWSPYCDIGVPRQTAMTAAAFWSQRKESNVIKTIMGGCFSFLHKPDLQTSTFSHYRSANIFLSMSKPVFFPKRLHFFDVIPTISLLHAPFPNHLDSFSFEV